MQLVLALALLAPAAAYVAPSAPARAQTKAFCRRLCEKKTHSIPRDDGDSASLARTPFLLAGAKFRSFLGAAPSTTTLAVVFPNILFCDGISRGARVKLDPLLWRARARTHVS